MMTKQKYMVGEKRRRMCTEHITWCVGAFSSHAWHY